MPEESKICFSQKIPVGPFQKAVKKAACYISSSFQVFFISFFCFQNKQGTTINIHQSFLRWTSNFGTQFLAQTPQTNTIAQLVSTQFTGTSFFFAPSWEQVDPEKKVQPDNDDLEDHIFYGWCCFYWLPSRYAVWKVESVVFTGFLAWFLLLNRFFWSSIVKK